MYPLTIWIAIQVGYTLLGVRAPFYFNKLRQKKKLGHVLHILSLLFGILPLLIPSVLTLGLGGYSPVDTKFPPIVCFARNRDVYAYIFLIPLAVLLSVIITELILILHHLAR